MQNVCNFIEAPLCLGTALAGTTGETSSRYLAMLFTVFNGIKQKANAVFPNEEKPIGVHGPFFIYLDQQIHSLWKYNIFCYWLRMKTSP